MTMHHPNATVRVFIEEATIVFREHVVQHARHGKCLNATRIAIDALAAFAIKAEPLSGYGVSSISPARRA